MSSSREADAGSGEPPLEERSCGTRFRYHPALPLPEGAQVLLAGEWDWLGLELMAGPDAEGAYTLDKFLPPGTHAYRYVLHRPGVADELVNDPDVTYRKYSGGVENSGMRVPDCREPLVKVVSFQAAGGRLDAELQFIRGHGGPGPDAAALTVDLRHLASTRRLAAPELDFAAGKISVHVPGLEAGKHTLVVHVMDQSGMAAATLRLPFWAEAQPYDWRDAVLYMVMVDRFWDGNPANTPPATTGAEPSADWQGGDLAGLTAVVESGYFESLGVRALWLSPQVANPHHVELDGARGVSGYHGYWPVASRDTEPNLGDPAALDALVSSAHAHGLRVLLDLVVNHVHEDHPAFRDHPAWFRTGCTCGAPGCDWTEHRLDCLFNPYMPDINWTVTEASESFIADALWWLDRFDLDGLRVDAVKHVEDLAVWNLATRVREEFEGAGTRYFLTGETAMAWGGDDIQQSLDDYETISRYIGPWQLDGQFDFVLFHAVVKNVFATSTRSMVHLDYWTLMSQEHYPQGAVMSPYIGSHDTSRFLSLADYRGQDVLHDSAVADHKWADQGLPTAPADAEPFERQALALTWLLTIPGAPMVYYGDEYGEHGGADPDNRHRWVPPSRRSAPQQALREQVERVGQARRELLPLRRGRYVSIVATQDWALYARVAGDQSVLVVLHNGAAPDSWTVTIPESVPLAGTAVRNVLDGSVRPVVERGFTVTLPARGAAVLVAE